jgi:hypothetical protein
MEGYPKTFGLTTPEGKGIIGSLDADGVVTFAIDAGPGSSVRGTELFSRMMRHFGDEVRAVHGVWRKGELGLPSANVDRVNELTSAGVPLEDAILQTWTVTRAGKLGFVRVRVLGQPVGVPGAYTEIDVMIERPEPAQEKPGT